MEHGPGETSNSSPKWQNLKFAEISVWRRVSDHFQAFGYFIFQRRGILSLCGCMHSFGWLIHCKQAEAPMRNFSIALVFVEKLHHPRCYKHFEKGALIEACQFA